jgi:hypothetical protein
MFSAKAKIVASLVFCLSLTLLGRPPHADTVDVAGVGKHAPMVLAQASPPRVSRTANRAIFEQLESHGAKMVQRSEMKSLIGGGPKKGGIACWGGAQCLILIEKFGTQCKDFRCNNDHGKAVCWCET